jgi:hypothetical protein
MTRKTDQRIRGTSPVPTEHDETAWLVEKEIEPAGVPYLTVEAGILNWTTDPNKALRFARRADADKICEIVEDADRVTEHMWPAIRVLGNEMEKRRLRNIFPRDSIFRDDAAAPAVEEPRGLDPRSERDFVPAGEDATKWDGH